MRDLFEKYKRDELSPSELGELRSKIAMDKNSEEFMKIMADEWNESEKEATFVPDETMFRIKDRIDEKIKYRNRVPFIYKAISIAAAILLPILLVFSVYFYQQTTTMFAHETVFKTKEGEKATIVLPDNSTVKLNYLSELRYSPGDFNKDERNIRFKGEAFFDVAKYEGKPFSVSTDNFKVRVLGTTFNLFMREGYKQAELYLKTGCVELTSFKNSESVIMQPNQKALIDIETGKMDIISEENDKSDAWVNNELVFEGVSLRDVVYEIEKAYNVKIDLQYETDDLFTGTLALDDLNGALEVISYAYGLRMIFEGGVITIKE